MNPNKINFNTLSTGNQKGNADWIYVAPNGMLKVSTQKLYIHLKENLNLKITEKGNLFLYEKPIYRLISPKEFKGLIKSYIPIEIRTEKDWEAVYKEFSTDEPNDCRGNRRMHSIEKTRTCEYRYKIEYLCSRLEVQR